LTRKTVKKNINNISEPNKKSYFAQANTYKGFINYFNNIFDLYSVEKIYVIKTREKSYSFILDKIAKRAEEKKYSVEYFLNPNDLTCLNGIIINELKTAVVVENLNLCSLYPTVKYPALIENTIDLCDFYDESKIIKLKKEIYDLSSKQKEYINLAYKFLRAANELSENTIDMSKKYMFLEKLDSSINRLIDKNIDEKQLSECNITKQNGAEYKFINSISAFGITELNTFENEAKKIFYISNENFLGYYYTKKISEKFADSCKVICPDVLNPEKIKAVYLKDTKTLFVIKNKVSTQVYGEKYNFINMDRFVNHDFKKNNKQKLKFIQKCYKSIIEEAVKYFKEAETVSNLIENIYASSTKLSDDEKNKYTEAIIKKILP